MTGNIAIIGTGHVGSTIAFTLAMAGQARELYLIDANEAKAQGEALDLRDGLPFLRPVEIHWGGYQLCREADLAIITAGANQKPGQTRLDLLHQNAGIFQRVIPSILEHNQHLIMIIVTNPVDPLTYLAQKLAGLPGRKVFGSGTVLDTARLRHHISLHCKINPRNVHGYVIGGHGEGAVPLWSSARIAGLKLEQFCRYCGRGCTARDEIGRKVRQAAEQIIARKGATYYAVSLAVRQIVQSILGNENSVLTVSTLVEEFNGLSNVCFSLPAIINSQGVNEILFPELEPEEKAALRNSVELLKQAQNQIWQGAEAPA